MFCRNIWTSSCSFCGRFFGTAAFLILAVACVISTVGTCFIALANDGFRAFWGSSFNWVISILNSPDKIKEGLKGSAGIIIAVLLVVVMVGVTINSIYFGKEKANKGRFIVSLIFAGLSIIFGIIAIVFYAK